MNLCRAYFDAVRNDEEQTKTTFALHFLVDAMTGIIAAGRTWGAGDWTTQYRRATEWHQRHLADTAAKRKTDAESLRKSRWESALERTDTGNQTFTPITNGLELTELALRLQNCLASYIRICTDGGCRIFSISDGSQEIGACELRKTDAGWEGGQVEGMKRRKMPPETDGNVRMLAKLYEEADEEKKRILT